MLSTLWNAIVRRSISVQPMQSPRLFSSCWIYQIRAEERARLKADPEKYQRHLLRDAAWKRNKYWKNPEYRRRVNEVSQLRHAEYRKTRELYARRVNLYIWITRYTWFHDLPWKSHRPLLYPQRTEHTCSSCGKSRSNGAKVWWESLASGEFTCYDCT